MIVQSRPPAYLERAKYWQFTNFSQGRLFFIWRAAQIVYYEIILAYESYALLFWCSETKKTEFKFQNTHQKKHIIVSELMTDLEENNYDIK